jgi:hypothetical protein
VRRERAPFRREMRGFLAMAVVFCIPNAKQC